MKRSLKIFATVLVAVIIVLGAATGWLMLRDPLAGLPTPQGLAEVTEQSENRTPGRIERHVVLRDPNVGSVGLFISLPDNKTTERLPIIILLGGLGTGAKNARYVRDPGDNALIAYDWPLPLRIPKGWAIPSAIPDLRRRLLSIPGQVTVALNWAKQQPWADQRRVSLLGFSLGALVVPAIQRLAEQQGHIIHHTVLAYGGIGLGNLIAFHPRVRRTGKGALLGVLSDLLLRPLEPALHLPHLRGRFLVITGFDDIFIPKESTQGLHALVPEPKTIIAKEGGHIGTGPRQAELLYEISALSRAWLIKEGAVNGQK